MAPSRKSRQEKPETMAWKLPMDLLREIIARSNHRTFVRCAATCNLLRREILSPPFDRRVTEAAPCILAYLRKDAKEPLSLIHPNPITPVALSLCYKHLPRFISRKFTTLLDKYEPVSSRHGLVVLLRRQSIEKRPKKSDNRCFDLCLYDPMSGVQTFFSNPPRSDQYRDSKYVVLTAADGINKSFLLLVFDLLGHSIQVHAASLCGTWRYVSYFTSDDFPWGSLKRRGDPAVLSGGVIHWLPCRGNKILSFNLGTEKTGWVKLPLLPPTNYNGNQLYLATSSNRKLLKLLEIQGFMMFVWLQLPNSARGGSGWSLQTVINMVDPNIIGGPYEHIEFEGTGKRTGEVVFLVRIPMRRNDDALIVFDLETNKMQNKQLGLSLLEIDLPSRLQAMKIFS